ncbi:MAG TPA: SH3 domain-containing protein [Pyrinomonadaceae bacterium]|nr:SH3 domain-containing protein [Pyrinomonadaceae bacterium]
MKSSVILLISLIFLLFHPQTEAQQRRQIPTVKKPATTAIVVDERLAVLREQPSLFAQPVQRMRIGKIIQILGVKEADGIMFYRVNAPPNNSGWVQADAIISKTKRGDDERMAKLVQAFDGFEQIECGMLFLETFPTSPLRPPILLLLGDLVEEIAIKLSNDATRRLDKRAMAASGAPLHSFYLNFVSLDRYRKLGIGFYFNSSTKLFHYNGANWREIVTKFPKSNEAKEAQKRLDSLKAKMEAVK